MKKKIVRAAAVAAILASALAAVAQPAPPPSPTDQRQQASQPDMAAFQEARIATIKDGLKLTAAQEKFWPPVESAFRAQLGLRLNQNSSRPGSLQDNDHDLLSNMRKRAARMADRAAELARMAAAEKAVADALGPLYATFDVDQKGRITSLLHLGPNEAGSRNGQQVGPGTVQAN
jgi:hypothetical protein